jgi:hypothetical protein
MKMDRVSLEIAIADGTFACHEINKASASANDGGFSSTAKIQRLLREMHQLLKGQALPGCAFTDVDLQAAYLAAETGDLRLAALIAGHEG